MRIVVLCLVLLPASVYADEFRAVVVTEQESAALRSAKARADEAQAAFAKLREATEAKYRERLGGAFSLDWSTDFRVIAERRWIDPQPLYRPGWVGGSVTLPSMGTRILSSPADMTGDTGILWGSLDIPIPITPPLTGPVTSPLVFK